MLCRRKMQRLGRNLFRFRRSVILVTCEAPRAHCGYTIIIRADGLWRPHLAPSRGEGVFLEAPIALHLLEVFSLIVIRVQVKGLRWGRLPAATNCPPFCGQQVDRVESTGPNWPTGAYHAQWFQWRVYVDPVSVNGKGRPLVPLCALPEAPGRH